MFRINIDKIEVIGVIEKILMLIIWLCESIGSMIYG